MTWPLSALRLVLMPDQLSMADVAKPREDKGGRVLNTPA